MTATPSVPEHPAVADLDRCSICGEPIPYIGTSGGSHPECRGRLIAQRSSDVKCTTCGGHRGERALNPQATDGVRMRTFVPCKACNAEAPHAPYVEAPAQRPNEAPPQCTCERAMFGDEHVTKADPACRACRVNEVTANGVPAAFVNPDTPSRLRARRIIAQARLAGDVLDFGLGLEAKIMVALDEPRPEESVICGHERLMKQAKDVVRAWEDDPTSSATENEIRELGLRADSAMDAAQRVDKASPDHDLKRNYRKCVDRIGVLNHALSRAIQHIDDYKATTGGASLVEELDAIADTPWADDGQPVSNLALAGALACVLSAWRKEANQGDGIDEAHAHLFDQAERYIERFWPSLSEVPKDRTGELRRALHTDYPNHAPIRRLREAASTIVNHARAYSDLEGRVTWLKLEELEEALTALDVLDQHLDAAKGSSKP